MAKKALILIAAVVAAVAAAIAVQAVRMKNLQRRIK